MALAVIVQRSARGGSNENLASKAVVRKVEVERGAAAAAVGKKITSITKSLR